MTDAKAKTRSQVPNPFERERKSSTPERKTASPQRKTSGFFKDLLGMTGETSPSGNNVVFEASYLQQSKFENKPDWLKQKAAIDYGREVLDFDKKQSQHELRDLNQKVQEIVGELTRLISSSQALKVEFAQVTIEQPPAAVGTYHLNFLEWMLTVIRTARHKVEDSGAWLNAIKGKKSKKMGYWGMFKKHGTSFGLSHERAVATQTG